MILHSSIDIQLTRRWFSERSTIGELFYPAKSGSRECFILEDVARAPEVKIPGVTCFASGDFYIKITESTRFKRLLPLIYNEEYYKDPVTGQEYYDLIRFGNVIFTGVRIHPGNTDADTEACQLPGIGRRKDAVYSSRDAFNPLFDKIYDQIGLTGRLNYRVINSPAV